MANESREESQAVLAAFQAKLASRELLPDRSLRRNSTSYPLVCYVNNITALLLSENYEPVPVFVARAAEHMREHPASAESDAYYSVLVPYLSHVVHHLAKYVGGIELDEDRIPSTILKAGPQQAPR